MKLQMWPVIAASVVILGGPVGSVAAQVPPQPAPNTPAIAPPRDIAYPGAIKLTVDATDLEHAIFSVHEILPVREAGPLTLLYPEWVPGTHAPSGPIDKLAGLVIKANGDVVAWKRDPVNVYAFHVDVPAGASALDLTFQYLSPVSSREGRVVMTPDMLNLDWDAVVLYPAGYYVRQIMVEPSIRLPSGFTLATALERSNAAVSDPGVVAFKPTPLNTLVDSAVLAGRYFNRFDLDPDGPAKVWLDVVADRPDELAVTPAQLAAHVALVRQASKLFASHHYAHYDFLLSLSDKMGGTGHEQHQSSQDSTIPKYFTDWDQTPSARDLLSHEYSHSWNGKFRRPADLWTANFNLPMRDSLLWVYEGQTNYWGYVLAARSGLLTRQEALDAFADTAATYDQQAGRAWRALEDTTNDPIISQRRPLSWITWQRSEDYYSEGQLIWLDADTLIRQRSNGKRSLDDFAKTFFGIDDGSMVTVTYGFGDVVKALNAVEPYDWAMFLRTRLQDHGPGAPLDGLARGGYRLVYSDVESGYFKSREQRGKSTDLSFSIGLSVGRDGDITGVAWDGPAFKAGLPADTRIVAVNGAAYDPDDLKDAIKAAEGSGPAVTLLVEDNHLYRTVRIDYHGGLKYPHLERIPGSEPRLDDILAPRG